MPSISKVNIKPILSQIETWLKDQTLSKEEVIDFFEKQTFVDNSAILSKWIKFTVLAQLTPEKKLLEEIQANFYELEYKQRPSPVAYFSDQSYYAKKSERLNEIKKNLFPLMLNTDTSLSLQQLKDYLYQQAEEERNNLQRRHR